MLATVFIGRRNTNEVPAQCFHHEFILIGLINIVPPLFSLLLVKEHSAPKCQFLLFFQEILLSARK
jgi:hypothetical protein